MIGYNRCPMIGINTAQRSQQQPVQRVKHKAILKPKPKLNPPPDLSTASNTPHPSATSESFPPGETVLHIPSYQRVQQHASQSTEERKQAQANLSLAKLVIYSTLPYILESSGELSTYLT